MTVESLQVLPQDTTGAEINPVRAYLNELPPEYTRNEQHAALLGLEKSRTSYQLLKEINPQDPDIIKYPELSRSGLFPNTTQKGPKRPAISDGQYEKRKENWINSFNSMDTQEQGLVIKKLRENIAEGKKLFDDIISHNLGLVVSIAGKYRKAGTDFLDLIQDGNIGLIDALKNYNPWKKDPLTKKPYEFSTYAYRWIKHAIERGTYGLMPMAIPAHVGDRIKEFQRTSNSLEETLGRKPTNAEIAKAMAMSEKIVEAALRSMERVSYLSETTSSQENDGNDVHLGDSIHSNDIPAEDRAIAMASAAALRKLLKKLLPPRTVSVVELRWGLVDGIPHSLGETGKEFGSFKQSIRDTEKNAFNKLRISPEMIKLAEGT